MKKFAPVITFEPLLATTPAYRAHLQRMYNLPPTTSQAPKPASPPPLDETALAVQRVVALSRAMDRVRAEQAKAKKQREELASALDCINRMQAAGRRIRRERSAQQHVLTFFDNYINRGTKS